MCLLNIIYMDKNDQYHPQFDVSSLSLPIFSDTSIVPISKQP